MKDYNFRINLLVLNDVFPLLQVWWQVLLKTLFLPSKKYISGPLINIYISGKTRQ